MVIRFKEVHAWMYLTLQTLLFEHLNIIPGQFLGLAIIYNVSVVRTSLLCSCRE